MTKIKLIPLETSTLRLVSPNIKYAKDVFTYSKDKDFIKYLDAVSPKHISDSMQFINKLINDNNEGKRCYWMILEKRNNHAVGTIGFIFSYSLKHKVVEFGYGLSRACWGKGLFQEAAKEVFEYGFKNSIEKVQVFTRENNISSIRAVQKLGFTREGNLIDFYQTDSGRINSVVLGLSKKQFNLKGKR